MTGQPTRVGFHAAVAALATAALLATVAQPPDFVATQPTSGTHPASALHPASATDNRPTAVVGLGDSITSGEAAGAYEPGTDQAGNFCHRSTRGQLQRAALADAVVNLACSGATSENVRLGGKPLYGEAPQAERLRAVARDYRVVTIVLTIGANDLGFIPIVADCLRAYLIRIPRCQDVWTPKLPAAVPATVSKVSGVLADVRTVMKEAGYGERDYDLVLQSYPSPVTERNRYRFGRLLHGCPIRDDDAQWAREVFVPQFATALGEVAAAHGARFLDLREAVAGHEVCAAGITKAEEWVTGIRIDIKQLGTGLGRQLIQRSLHPNELGHAHLGACLRAFAASPEPAARCTSGLTI